MNFRSALSVVLVASVSLSAFAQNVEDEEKLERELGLPSDHWYVPKTTLRFGFRVLTSGVNVNFGNLGTVTSTRAIVPASAGDINRIYDNGAVALDLPGFNEVDANGVQTSIPGGRYQVLVPQTDGSVGLALDGVSFTPGQTRFWNYVSDDQVIGGLLGLSNFSAASEGATASKDEGMSSGVELSVSRDLGKVGSRFQISVDAGIALNSMNAKTGGTVRSTLTSYTDYFRLNGPTPTEKGGPTYGELVLPDGTIVAQGYETTTPLQTTPDASLSATTSVVGGASVQGNWQIKGAYFLMRLGPSVHTQLSERFGMSFGAGVAGAYAGSRYSVVEQLELPDLAEPLIEDRFSNESKFLTGYYADLNFGWQANERTGLFAGVGLQHLGSYDQSVGGRTAKIEMGSAVGVRGGISIKF
ncbi:MAG: hypothetical protein Q8J74_04340 [Candidatus Didemnitutus sp.]|nr:hypothetical protein [Candidatus Didemnitutus sp.]